ncbi:inner membrane CreD family protein [Suttonella ornithocola]|uniref:Inner membrane protein CreD n=1 Tax=Suttonella ornithocola TaxID=279832 RepID=A0A380MUY5_9GAMM|nr:inner membrane CreD family protein [Suttonella ornithocola]SUO95856.1 Inner membrane protein CreD [Suttonella ornithocola]
MKSPITQKLLAIFLLCLIFTIALALIYQLTYERMNYLGNLNQVDDYRRIMRSIKYGMVLVGFTFAIFFLFELIRELKIHPIQYGLVGSALTIFYLLLLSLSEQIGFSASYIIASIACISLISWYMQYSSGETNSYLIIGGLLLFGYSVMFILIRLTKYNLLIGSILLFIAIATTMYLTRYINWYELSIYHKKAKIIEKEQI